MLRELRPTIVILLASTLVLGLIYPLAITGVAQLVFPAQANGSLVMRNGQPIGSALIGQAFTRPDYFHPRPSATTAPDPHDASKTVPAPYNAAASAASNLSPTARALADRVRGDVSILHAQAPGAPVSQDAVTTSASGLDPDISPANAYAQVARVAAARHQPEARIRALVQAQLQPRALGILGEPRVNVLALNLALDAMH
jgi:potassium-transporting ATPase KdpC subunit